MSGDDRDDETVEPTVEEDIAALESVADELDSIERELAEMDAPARPDDTTG